MCDHCGCTLTQCPKCHHTFCPNCYQITCPRCKGYLPEELQRVQRIAIVKRPEGWYLLEYNGNGSPLDHKRFTFAPDLLRYVMPV